MTLRESPPGAELRVTGVRMRPAAFRLNELGIGLGMLAHCSRQAPFGGRVIAGGMNPGARSIDGGDHLAAGRAAGGHQCDQLRHVRANPACRRAGRPAARTVLSACGGPIWALTG